MRRDELRVTVATLQKALDAAHQRIREQERAGAEMNRRFAEVQAQRDELEVRLHDWEDRPRRGDATA